jgi:hypothetical protein
MASARSFKNDTSKLRTHNIQLILMRYFCFILGLVLMGGHYGTVVEKEVPSPPPWTKDPMVWEHVRRIVAICGDLERDDSHLQR